jgi:hypothetical protein
MVKDRIIEKFGHVRSIFLFWYSLLRAKLAEQRAILIGRMMSSLYSTGMLKKAKTCFFQT